MKERSTNFKKKYKKAKECSNFFVYAVSSGKKSSRDLVLNRELNLITLKKINMPSSFRLEKAHNTQGPIINIIYGRNLNFTKLNYLEKFKVLGVKINCSIYSYRVLKDVVFYKTPINLCRSFNLDLFNRLIDLAVLTYINKKNNALFLGG